MKQHLILKMETDLFQHIKHSNGKGWVADSAYVAKTVYVGVNARVFGNARVYDIAIISGTARVFGNAIVCQNMCIEFGDVDSDLTDKANIKQNIFAQTGLICEEDYVICYKKVNKNLTSWYDENFQYVIGEWAEAENPEISDESCTSGLHFSHKTYWNVGNILLECKVMLEDIITVQMGKIRVKKCFVIGKVE